MILYTVENLVEVLQVNEQYIRRWIRSGVLPVYKTNPLRFRKDQIDEWVADGNLDRHRPNVVRAETVKGIWES